MRASFYTRSVLVIVSCIGYSRACASSASASTPTVPSQVACSAGTFCPWKTSKIALALGKQSFITTKVALTPYGRWDPKTTQFAGFLREGATPLLPIIKELAEELAKHDLGLAEASIRWLQHHSTLDPKKGDKILIGANSPQQLETNLKLQYVFDMFA